MKDYTERSDRTVSANTGTLPNAEDQDTTAKAVEYDQGLRAYMLRVYNHMAIGVGITGAAAYAVYMTPPLLQLIVGTPLFWIIALAELGFVFYFSARINTMSESTARTIFYTFAVLNGLVFSVYFLAYTTESIARVFFITSAMFGAMSLYGYTTKKDLTGWGSFLFMGLIGIILASLVNIFLQSSGLHFAVSVIGVLIFTGLTAYDTQKIKHNYYLVGQDQLGKAAISGALSLYLDFINLMIMLLRFMGDRR